MVTATLNAWASAMGIDQQTLERRLVKAGIDKPKVGWGKITFKTIYAATMGDEQAEKIRNLKADADRKEREEREAMGLLFPMPELEEWLTQNYLVPMANVLSSMATTLDTRCNPENPLIARRAISDYVEQTIKPALKAELEKPRK